MTEPHDLSSSPDAAADAEATTLDAVSAAETEALRLLAEQKDKYLRLYAEFENFRKRAVKERLEAEQRGMAVMASGLLDAMDDLSRFAHVDPATTAAQTLVDGVAMVEKKVIKTLTGHGLEVVNPEGAAFDPALHEALTTMPAALPEEDNRVAQVYQVGYTFNGQLLRPARVVVKQWHS